ncbi:hypothetical protein KAJ27_06890 [bacterium]|nr:hypothetical protein [bacterium]
MKKNNVFLSALGSILKFLLMCIPLIPLLGLILYAIDPKLVCVAVYAGIVFLPSIITLIISIGFFYLIIAMVVALFSSVKGNKHESLPGSENYQISICEDDTSNVEYEFYDFENLPEIEDKQFRHKMKQEYIYSIGLVVFSVVITFVFMFFH